MKACSARQCHLSDARPTLLPLSNRLQTNDGCRVLARITHDTFTKRASLEGECTFLYPSSSGVL